MEEPHPQLITGMHSDGGRERERSRPGQEGNCREVGACGSGGSRRRRAKRYGKSSGCSGRGRRRCSGGSWWRRARWRGGPRTSGGGGGERAHRGGWPRSMWRVGAATKGRLHLPAAGRSAKRAGAELLAECAGGQVQGDGPPACSRRRRRGPAGVRQEGLRGDLRRRGRRWETRWPVLARVVVLLVPERLEPWWSVGRRLEEQRSLRTARTRMMVVVAGGGRRRDD